MGFQIISSTFRRARCFDSSTAVFSGNTFNVSAQGILRSSIVFNNTGNQLFIMGAADDSVHTYNLTTPFDITTMSYSGDSFDASVNVIGATGVTLSRDGTKMFIIGPSNGFAFETVLSYNLSIAWDVTTAGLSTLGFSLTPPGITSVQGIDFSADGLKMFVLGSALGKVVQYDLLDAYQLLGATLSVDDFDFTTQDSDPFEIKFSPDGKNLFMAGNTSDTIYQYDLSSPFDLTTVIYSGNSLPTAAQDNQISGIGFNPVGTKMLAIGRQNSTIYEYDLCQ